MRIISFRRLDDIVTEAKQQTLPCLRVDVENAFFQAKDNQGNAIPYRAISVVVSEFLQKKEFLIEYIEPIGEPAIRETPAETELITLAEAKCKEIREFIEENHLVAKAGIWTERK